MITVVISGISGAMGGALLAAIENESGMTAAFGVDIRGGSAGVEVYPSFDACGRRADVLIDFSSPAALSGIVDYCRRLGVPAVLCATGYSPEQEAEVRRLSETLPVFRSANMSLGVNLLSRLAAAASAVLGGFDIEIVEQHHRKKVDSPSGTAKMLYDAINAANGGRYRCVFERESRRERRSDDEIGVHSVRGGTIVGEHAVIFAGNDEVVTISHSASSKNVFASGAIAAAKFLLGRPAGLYSMDDLLDIAQ